MIKKIYVPMVLALVAALAFSSVAFAKSALPAGVVRRVGDVISVNLADNTIKINNLSGVHYTLHVTSATIYRGISGLAALKRDDRLSMEVKQLSDGSWTADRVKLITENENVKDHGIVTNITASSFTIMNSLKQSFTFQVTSTTLFSGHNVPHLRDLQLGMAVTVTFQKIGTMMYAKDVVVIR